MQSYYEAHREKITYIDFMETPSFCEPHFHSAVEILYASEGAVDTFINGAPRMIGKGEICISDSYDVHNFDSHAYSSFLPIFWTIISKCGAKSTWRAITLQTRRCA